VVEQREVVLETTLCPWHRTSAWRAGAEEEREAKGKRRREGGTDYSVLIFVVIEL
jgi:hypothetical protein